MELLQLQDRARAIRSHLALEPVTKIELHLDNDSVNGSPTKIVQESTSFESSSKCIVQENNGKQIIKANVVEVTPVRLKRNFRQRRNDDNDSDEEDGSKLIENSQSKEVANFNEKEKYPSPDVIPIIEEPETYCISSDSDEV